MIHEPQDAAAAGICWLARWSVRGRLHGLDPASFVGSRHPRECGWCIYPMDGLVGWLADFNFRDGPKHLLSTRFRALPHDAQVRLVNRSLYFEESPVPA